MTKKAISLVTVVTLIAMSSTVYALNGFVRGDGVPAPEPTVNQEGYGGILAGMDIDGDNNPDIYVVNDMFDGGSDYIPRIYKLEPDGLGSWHVVWAATAPIDKQNTWPGLTTADLDGDGKEEVIWGPTNWATTDMPNPPRILVYEEAGDGSDVMGVATTATHSGGEDLHFAPNAQTSIVDTYLNLRPTKFTATDIDGDGTQELCYNDRKGNSNGPGVGHYFGVISVSDIPDAGGGTEIWTLEASMLSTGINTDTATIALENKWDSFVIGNNLYLVDEVGITKITATAANTYEHAAQLPPTPGGMSMNSAQTTDLDGDGTYECIIAEYDYGSEVIPGIYLLQESADGLTSTLLAMMDATMYDSAADNRFAGGALGDVDGDGYDDFVCGNRYSPDNASIYRLAYRGGDITDATNYELTIIDSVYAEGGSLWDVIAIGNIDDDPEDEILYGHRGAAGVFPNTGTQDIVVLDYESTSGIFVRHTIPLDFSIKQNYPNPFNPTTTIEYELRNSGKVNISIYNLLGHKVKNLFSDTQQSGSYNVVWDGTNDQGSAIAAGTYIYEVQVNNQAMTRKMVLLK